MSVTAMLLRAALVFGLLAVTLWLIKRGTGGLKLGRRGQPLQVLGSAKLGKGAAVAVVRIGDANYALGVTDHAVTLLTEAPTTAEEPVAALEAAPAEQATTPALHPAVSAGKAFLDAFLANLKNNARTVAGRRRGEQPLERVAAVATPAEPAAIEAPSALTFADLLAEADERDEIVLTLPDVPAAPLQTDADPIELDAADLLPQPAPTEVLEAEPVLEAFPADQVAATAAALDARLARRIGARLGTLQPPALATAADGSAAYPAPRARARTPRRTDAVSRNEEHPWSTSCRMSGHVERFRRSPF